MEAKRWGFAFTVAIFTMTILLVFNGIMESPIGELRSILLPLLQRGDGSTREEQATTFALSPNLSACHSSVHLFSSSCCPPPKELQETNIVDFQFPDPSSPLRLRRPVHLLDENYIAKYQRALSIMKSLPYSDPRSWSRQADLHCLFCTASYDQQGSNIPLDIHRSWLFFPWHRMMLYFHERILGSLIGDDTFALPFWAWDLPEAMKIPDIYLNTSTFIDKQRDGTHLSRVVDLGYKCLFKDEQHYKICGESRLTPEEEKKHNLALMYHQMVSGAKKFELFMGCSLKAGEGGQCDGPGTIESSPHNSLHNWLGSNLNKAREDMGLFYSAARDPIFYPHHTNIDRLWEVWKMLHDQKQIDDPDWLESSFFFHDEKLQLVRIKFRDVLNITKLGYGYEKLNFPWLNSRPKPSVPPKVARPILKMRHSANSTLQNPSNQILLTGFRPDGQALNSSITLKVSRPKVNRSKEEKEEEEEVLVVYGIDVKQDIHVKFDVYVNIVDEKIVNAGSREFAGQFVHIPAGLVHRSREGGRRKSNLKLGISELLEDLEAEGDETIWVTLMPRSDGCINITVDGIRIEYVR